MCDNYNAIRIYHLRLDNKNYAILLSIVFAEAINRSIISGEAPICDAIFISIFGYNNLVSLIILGISSIT